MLILVIGDFHIPDRVPKISEQFKRLLVPGKIDQIICLGNLTTASTFDFLKHVCSDVKLVKGQFDIGSTAPVSGLVKHGAFKIAYTSGHLVVPRASPEALSMIAREMDADIFLSGTTHRFEAYEMDGCFFINPGSATGAPGASVLEEDEAPVPSFVLVDIQGSVLILYVYRIFNEEVRVEKLQYRKPE
ncbi:retromer complex subunit Vps29 [Schizosaccharomyces japonicus yFS275]|uniref:Vacuolar protein sorting-associated protein 29 n=1 Tax=Schizosaccharomyces japonicus (strain yFS275 / FY16936) TaxID=402676 RepID=B6K7C1_SCHJY|nr:retromer complex subunit Vps29 [Schizosaccharomyces japonicus yFS275]EEB09425.2 retromer complex subunit Vps29 [Schizosaccharomyces japonicus yFS275]